MSDTPLKLPKLPEREGLEISAEAFDMISRILRNLKGFNLAIYKDKCIRRRIGIRIRATGSSSAEDYCDYLLRNDRELDRLLKVLTIHVSHFFRNPQTYEKLKKEILPKLFAAARADGGRQLNCWSVGCAGGEEPYSLAILMKENFSSLMDEITVSIVGTDVDSVVLEQARDGVYGEERLLEVPEKTRHRWFTDENGRFRLDPEIKGLVEFRKGDAVEVTPFTTTDLILCRNMLIYLERHEQERIIKRFAEVLRKDGILVLGKSETLVGESRQKFKTICPVERIYQVIS